MSKIRQKPGYTLHKPTGQARVRIGGKDHYLGDYGTPASRDRYDDLIREWFAKQGDVAGLSLTVDDLALLYLAHCDTYYRKDGEPTGEAENVRRALRFAVQLYGTTRAREFGPRALRHVRDEMVKAGLVRQAINIHVSRIRRMFKWATDQELTPASVWQTLTAVDGLRYGRSKARESTPVPPVPAGTVNDTLPHLPRVVADMVRLQLLTGARPTEVCTLRPCDITRGTNGVWTYRPPRHKTEHHGRERRIFIGPEGQAVLGPYLDRDPEAYCFTPAEAEASRSETRRANRRSPMTPSQLARKPKGRPLRPCYTKDTYNRAVARGCEAAFGMPAELRNVSRTIARMKDVTAAEREATKRRLNTEASAWRAQFCWSPNQLRHSRATLIREQ